MAMIMMTAVILPDSPKRLMIRPPCLPGGGSAGAVAYGFAEAAALEGEEAS
jgi:hypothetical protein